MRPATIICGIDDSPEALVGLEQAIALSVPETALVLAAVEVFVPATGYGYRAEPIEVVPRAVLERALANGLEQARRSHETVESVILTGPPATALREEAASRGADLLVVGSHGHTRLEGIVIGSTTSALLHESPCSVLVARPAPEPAETWPASIVVGVDGSEGSLAAFDAAAALAERLGGSLRALVSVHGRERVDLDRVRERAADVEETTRAAVDALVEASKAAGLVVVGSRGMTGVKALGSVSERVGHRARSSVLVVRSA